MAFHRLTLPSYFGGLPAGYDYMNSPQSPAQPATADGAKIGGPNQGTYFSAFGEDATSNYQNRPHQALAENTDVLDDLLHRDMAVPALVTGTGPISSVSLPAGTYLGPGGLANNTVGLKGLFTVLDATDQVLEPIAGDVVQAATVTGSVGDVAKITGSGGFSDGPVGITLTTSIPDTVAYRVWYAARSNLATVPAAALVNLTARLEGELAACAGIFRSLHGGNLAWNAQWTSTIYDLTFSGLNERYRHASAGDTLTPAPYILDSRLDTPGAGGWYWRDGRAISAWSAFGYRGAPYVDPINALWSAYTRDSEGASTGFVFYGKRRLTGLGYESSYKSGFASFLHVVERDAASSSANAYTCIGGTSPGGGASCILSHDGDNALITLTNTERNWWQRVVEGSMCTSVSPGYDLVEVWWNDGTGEVRPHTYVIRSVATDHAISVVDLTGAPPAFTSQSAEVRYLPVHFAVGDGSTGASTVSIGRGLFYSMMPPTGYDTETLARRPMEVYGSDLTATPVLTWGGHEHIASGVGIPAQPTGYMPRGALNADGSIRIDTNIAPSRAPAPNTMYANSMIKAWGHCAHAIGGPVLRDGFNVESAATGDQYTLTVDLADKRDYNNCAIITTLHSSGPRVFQPTRIVTYQTHVQTPTPRTTIYLLVYDGEDNMIAPMPDWLDVSFIVLSSVIAPS